MATKPGFMIYHIDYHALDELDDAAHRRVMDAMCEYSECGCTTVELVGAERVVFAIMRNALDRDCRKYEKRVEAGRAGGLRSGEARSKTKQTEANRSNAKQTEANEPIPIPTPTPIPIPIPTPIPSLSPREGDAGEERERIYPTVEEVREYAERMGLRVNAEEFVKVNGEKGWMDSFGRPIRDWQTWLLKFPGTTGAAQTADKPKPTALNFQQREYTEGELDYVFDRFRNYTGGTDGAETDGDV